MIVKQIEGPDPNYDPNWAVGYAPRLGSTGIVRDAGYFTDKKKWHIAGVRFTDGVCARLICKEQPRVGQLIIVEKWEHPRMGSWDTYDTYIEVIDGNKTTEINSDNSTPHVHTED